MENHAPEVVLTAEQLPQTSIPELLPALRSLKRPTLAFFDSPAAGYVLVPVHNDEALHQVTVNFDVSSGSTEKPQRVHIATLALNTPVAVSETHVAYHFHQLIPFPKAKLEDPVLEITVAGQFESKRHLQVKESNVIHSGYPVDRRNILNELASVGSSPKSVLPDTLIKDNKVDIVPVEEEHKDEEREGSPERQFHVSKSIKIIRLLNLRIRNVRISKSSILSTIDLESSSKARDMGISTTLDSIHHGFQRTTHPRFNHDFPITLSGDDSYSFTYLLESHEAINFKSLITINYSCNAQHIQTKLLTNVDFITQFNPPQVPKKHSSSQTSLPSNSPTLTKTQSSTLSSCLVVKFIGTKSVTLGVPFKLTVQVHNITRKPRNLVLVFNGGNDGFLPNLPKIRSLVLPFNTILKQYVTTKLRNIGVLALDNEVHIKAEAGAVFETEVRFVGLESGVTCLTGTTITDVNSGEAMSLDKLLEIVVN